MLRYPKYWPNAEAEGNSGVVGALQCCEHVMCCGIVSQVKWALGNSGATVVGVIGCYASIAWCCLAGLCIYGHHAG
jgi:hypothetical protein